MHLLTILSRSENKAAGASCWIACAADVSLATRACQTVVSIGTSQYALCPLSDQSRFGPRTGQKKALCPV